MRAIINYIRSLFCHHDWVQVANRMYYDGYEAKLPYKEIIIYRCKRCGAVQRIRL